ncbi:MAG TPA: T9SS type A sorting domain-containing protein, partial [Chitinophagales bacterium]|nr:T9SS type A sorting domain-containing protein [Chitinophagales bacterium]
DSQGTLDLSFGNNGVFSMQIYSSDDKPTSAALQPDGKILMAGYLQKYPDYDQIILLRITGEGKVDSSFGTYGSILTLVNCDDSRAKCLALDGNYIYAGGGRHSIYGESCIVRYLNGCDVPQGMEVVNIAPTLVALDWNDASGADSYKLRYKVSGSGSWQKVAAQVSEKKIGGLLPATKYSVQARSNCSNPAAASDWSKKFQFTTPPQKLSEAVVSSHALEVYPNPFSENAVVQFQITKSTLVEISLFNLQGRKIKTIAAGSFVAGNHQIMVNRENIHGGCYLLKITCGVESGVEKIIIQ